MMFEQQPTRRRFSFLPKVLLGAVIAAGSLAAARAEDNAAAVQNAAPVAATAPTDIHAWTIVHQFQPGIDLTTLGCPPAKEKTGNRLLSLDLKITDVAVVCQLLHDYDGKPDIPVKLIDNYAPVADRNWRQQIRDACVAKTDAGVGDCAREAAKALNEGIEPRDTEGRAPDDVPSRVESYRDWNRPDRTLIEFEWTPCTPYLVARKWDQWRLQHLNIATTGSEPSGQPMKPAGPLPHLDNKKTPVEKVVPGAEPVTDPILKNVCLRGATVRTAIRERWANYAHVALREDLDPITEPDPACTDCGLRYKEGGYAPKAMPHSLVNEIVWKNTWLDRQQWLVMVRDHFLARLQTEGLDPAYDFSGTAHLVYCGPEIQYGGVPTGKHYYWHNMQPADKENCMTWRPDAKSPPPSAAGYKELTISYDRDATIVLSRGPAFQDNWERDQSRLVGRAAERLARYQTVAPLVQNDSDPTALADCRKPLPANGNAGKCNAEAPRRDAVTPRIGDVFGVPVAQETPQK